MNEINLKDELEKLSVSVKERCQKELKWFAWSHFFEWVTILDGKDIDLTNENLSIFSSVISKPNEFLILKEIIEENYLFAFWAIYDKETSCILTNRIFSGLKLPSEENRKKIMEKFKYNWSEEKEKNFFDALINESKKDMPISNNEERGGTNILP